jgi:DcmR-like sensory protein
LHLISGNSSGDALLEEIGERVKAAVDRGEPLVRIFGNLGWGFPGWPTDTELLRLEARVTDVIRNLPVVVMCAYDARGVPGRNFHLGGLECHPWAFHRNALRPNDQYVPAEQFLAALDRERA